MHGFKNELNNSYKLFVHVEINSIDEINFNCHPTKSKSILGLRIHFSIFIHQPHTRERDIEL